MFKKGNPFKKFCDRCGKMFSPSTKTTRICEKCLVKGMNERTKKNRIKRENKLKVIGNVT